ncbi:Predicted N-acetyltransferase YhbS [Marinobacter zhejiangensis]|uniref:Predicted N-acetyltransferase YhbS n=2 Tax=Marinobacter zhejiangensis TaxID=488535 RepID=A0A1I4THK3_9GAMM|nr:Predicted N-acetyltransferase YhbS [Marinobacter zhejiangensis]
MSMTIRAMRRSDLSNVLDIQSKCYTELEPESEASFDTKLRLSPTTCFVACDEGTVVGYLIAIPWVFANPPALDAVDIDAPLAADCLYLHDLAVAPEARNSGAGRALVDQFFPLLKALQLERACLVAVQSSAPYWRRHGFQTVSETPSLAAKLASYGSGAQYMEYLAPQV